MRLLFLISIFFLFQSNAFAQQPVINYWRIDDANLTDGKLDLRAGDVRSLVIKVSVTRFMSNNQYSAVDLTFKPVRFGTGNYVDLLTSTFKITTSDFNGGGAAEKEFVVPVQAVGAATPQEKNLRNNDRINFLVRTVAGDWIASTNKDYSVSVELQPIKGNSICCSSCIGLGSSPGVLSQKSGTSLSGGDRDYKYQWKKSVDGVNFSNISGANLAAYNPGNLQQTTWFKRSVESSSSSSTGWVDPVESTPVLIEVINGSSSPTIPATNYTESTTIKAWGTMSITGDQTHPQSVFVSFLADNQIIIKPSTTIPANTDFKIGTVCTSSSSGGRLAEDEQHTQPSAFYDVEALENSTTAEAVFNEAAFGLNVFPNPAKETITISYSIDRDSYVRLYIIDGTGKEKFMLDEKKMDAGYYEYSVNAQALQPGLYTCILLSGNKREIKRLVISAP